ncbi:toll-like receptor 4 [Saccostrea echinata]|uniref:toll-like receptor 4 n=1 Tax=Saccostrea echinata TaxID=191078 RepID=UPI002A80CA4C|nr:toll-like receptor 4 [Saccostrea echinata]
MAWVYYVVFSVVVDLLVSGENCTSSGLCSCSVTRNGIRADCGNLNISDKDLPVFTDRVTEINLSHNNLTKFPTTLPSNMIYLDLCNNDLEENVINTSSLTFGNSLLILKLDNNVKLRNISSLKTVFDRFVNLKNLSMKNTPKDQFSLRRNSFPERLLENLVHLIRLDFNGYNHGVVSDLFNGFNNSVEELDLSGNNGSCSIDIIGRDMFEYLTKIRFISISYCRVISVNSGAFEHLFYLNHLDISNNEKLTLDVLKNLTFSRPSSIRKLCVNNVQCTFGLTTEIRVEHVSAWNETNLEDLHIASNRIAYLDRLVLGMLPKTLRIVNIADNQLIYGSYLYELQSLESLTILNISFQVNTRAPTIANLFEECESRKLRRHSPLRRLRFPNWETRINPTFTFYMPPRLQTIYVDRTRYSLSVSSGLILANNSVTHLHASRNLFFEIRSPMLGLQKVEHVDLSKNVGDFLVANSFYDCKNLKFLNLSYNFLGRCLENDTEGNIFNGLYNLETFDLSYNRILSLSKMMLKSFHNIKYLNISFNKLSEWNVEMEHMKRLELLDLSYNEISIFSDKTIRDLNSIRHSNTTQINLYNNPLRCSCESLQFLKWMNSSKYIRFIHVEKYICHFSNGTTRRIGDIHWLILQMERECSSYSAIITICVLAIFAFATHLVRGILYRYRWRIRYIYYNAKRKYKNSEKKIFPTKFRFDAFISYAEEDRGLFIDDILRLEKSESARYCLHCRDFIPGTNIADNIINAIRNSRKTVCMLSINYLKSRWCMFEFNMARMESIYSTYRHGENVIFLVVLNDSVAAHKDLSPSMINLMESQSYLKYPKDRKETPAFWEKFSIKLQDFTGTL